jgi:ABC-type transport system involved in multi-copper enzyme maturation permease subunit
MASAMFSVLVLPPLLFVLCLIAGLVAGFVLDRFFGDARAVNGNDGFAVLSLLCAVSVAATLSMLTSPPPLGMTFPISTYVTMFVACALVAFWHNVRMNRRRPPAFSNDKRTLAAPVKMKLEIRPDEDMTVVVVYSAKDGSFANREIFSAEAKKDQRYVWEIDIPRISGTATVYLVTGGTGSWAGSKDYEF